MIDERRETQASMYVLGVLPDDELLEFESAMRADLDLQMLVKELHNASGAMVAAYPRVSPPAGFKQRVLAAVDARETARASVISLESERPVSWIAWVPWALAACFAVLCVALISIGQSLRQQAVGLNEELGERNTEATELRRQMDALQARVVQQTTNYQDRLVEVQKQVLRRIEDLNRQTAALTNQLRQQQAEAQRQMVVYRDQAERLAKEKKVLEEALTGIVPGGAEQLSTSLIAILKPTEVGPPNVLGAAVWSPSDQRGLLVLEHLPALPPNQSYQLWLIDPKLNSPASGGVLPPTATGSLRIQYSTQLRVETVQRFAVSVEPRGGSATPLGKIVFASN